MALTRITKGVIKPNENYDTHNIVSTGIVTSVGLDVNGNADISGSLSVGGVLTYEDVTSIDSVGIITARSGIDADDFISVGNNIHLGNAGVITATSFVGSGAALTGIDATAIKDSGGNVKVQAQASGAMYTGIHTFSSGAEVGSNIQLGNAGVITATSFSGDGSGLTGIDATKIITGNTQVQTIDTGSDGHIKFITEGSERARILANGNIGIGEDAPVAKVHIAGSNYVSVGGGGFDSNTILALTRNFTVGQSAGLALNSGTSATSFIHLGDADDPDIGKITYDHVTNSMKFAANTTERLRITSGGDIITQGLTNRSFNNDGNNAKVLEVTGDGTVGEYGVLNLSGNQNSSANVGAIKFINRENSNSSSGGNANSRALATIDVFADTSDSNAGDDCGGFMRFVTKADGGGNAERLRITSDGKIGIGEDDPDGNYLLIRAASTVGTTKGHIMLTGDSATVGQGPQIVFSESGSGSSYAGAYIGHMREGTNSTGNLVFGTRETGGDANTVPTERLRITSAGRVALGGETNPGHTFHVRGDAENCIKWIRTGSSVGGSLYSDGGGSGIVGGDGVLANTGIYLVTDTRIDFRVNGSERFRVDSNGFVGVNFTSTQNWGAKFRVGGLLLSDQGAGSPYVFGKLSSVQDFVIGRTDTSGTLTEHFRIKAGGNVLIGTDTGSEKLCIKRDDAIGPTITLENNANKTYINNWGSSGGSGRTNRFEINATLTSQASYCASYHTFMTGGVGDSNEKVRITSDGRLLVNSTAVTNTDDFLTVKRPVGNTSVTSMTVDASTSTGSYANALIFTKAKDYYFNGLVFTSSTGHQGGIAAKMTAGGGTTPEIQIRIGGTSLNQSDTLAMSVKNTGTVQSYYHATSRNGIVQVQQVTSETRYSGSIASVDLITGSTFTPKTSAPRFLIMIFCPVNTSDDSDAGNGNRNDYFYGRIEYRKNGGSWLECDNQGSTSNQGGFASHIELSPNRTGSNSTDYWSGNRYRMEHKNATILVTNVGDCGDGGNVQFKLRGGSYSGSFVHIGQPHGYGTDDNYPVQPWGFTVFELAPDNNSYTAY